MCQPRVTLFRSPNFVIALCTRPPGRRLCRGIALRPLSVNAECVPNPGQGGCLNDSGYSSPARRFPKGKCDGCSPRQKIGRHFSCHSDNFRSTPQSGGRARRPRCGTRESCPAILRGTEKPANAAEQIEFAQLCILKKPHAAATRCSCDAFTAEPKPAEVVPASTRYNAPCAAALAACGQGKDADQLDDQEHALWRRQALAWLRQDLTWWGKALDNGNAHTNAQVRPQLRHWQADGDLAAVRAKDALRRLPDEERMQRERLWSNVDAPLRRVSEPKRPPAAQLSRPSSGKERTLRASTTPDEQLQAAPRTARRKVAGDRGGSESNDRLRKDKANRGCGCKRHRNQNLRLSYTLPRICHAYEIRAPTFPGLVHLLPITPLATGRRSLSLSVVRSSGAMTATLFLAPQLLKGMN
jgi:hypothetical protein